MSARVSKFTISLPEELLAEIDVEAEASGLSRSAVIREASATYLQQRREHDALTERRRRGERAMAIMRDIAQTPARDDRPTLEILREIRSADGLGQPPVTGRSGGT